MYTHGRELRLLSAVGLGIAVFLFCKGLPAGLFYIAEVYPRFQRRHGSDPAMLDSQLEKLSMPLMFGRPSTVSIFWRISYVISLLQPFRFPIRKIIHEHGHEPVATVAGLIF